MYNDYYLQQIDNKLLTNNNKLQDIQEEIQISTSGDKEILKEIKNLNTNIVIIQLVIVILLLYKFIERCFR